MADGLFAQLKEQLGITDDRPTDFDEVRRNFIKTYYAFRGYVAGTKAIVDGCRDRTLVFIERDGLPAMHVAREYANRRGYQTVFRSVVFTRKMFPPAIETEIDELRHDPANVGRIREVAVRYARTGKLGLGRTGYLTQELGDLTGAVTFVDVAYFGSCAQFLATWTSQNTNGNADFRLIYGPPDDELAQETCEPNYPTYVEDAFKYGRVYTGRIVREGDSWVPKSVVLGHQLRSTYEAELAGLIDVLDVSMA